MPFKNGEDNVVSNSAPIRIGGVLPIGLDAQAANGYNPIFTTRLVEDGVDEKGNPFYKTEVYKFNSAKEANNFKNKVNDNEAGLRKQALALNKDNIIATGSTRPGEKNFEFTKNASDIDKKFTERIYTVQKRQVKQIVKDEGDDDRTGRASTAYGTKDKSTKELKKDLKNFGQNSTQENPKESVDKPTINPADLRQGIGRDSYGVLFYPNYIQKSSQDKLKITVLKPSTRLLSSTTVRGQGIKQGQGSSVNLLGEFAPRYIKQTRGSGLTANDIKNKNKNKNIKEEIGGAATLDNRRRTEFGKRTIGHITLPIPNGVTDTNKVNFGSGTLNPFQVGVAGVALKTLLEGLGAGAEEASSIFRKEAKNPQLKPALANLITSSIIGVDNNELLARGEGVIVNNNLELLFKGPTLRPFTFQFVFSPRDRGEAVQVQKIIRCFKQSSAVQRTPGGIFLAAPNTYRLQFFKGPTPHKFLPKIKECALLSVSVNYMPENSYMTYEDSSMVAYSVNLAFQELEPIFNDDYDKVDEEFGTLKSFEELTTVDPNNEEAISISFDDSTGGNTPDSGGIGF